MILVRLSVFFKSLLFHVWSGFPKSTQEEILSRYEICNSCDEFDKVRSQCSICGCNINKRKIFLNKLAWADQECPKGKWGKIIRN